MIPYATATEIKAAFHDGGVEDSIAYDANLRRLSERASRMIDRLTGRTFWPEKATRYPHSAGGVSLHLEDDLLEITTVSMSSDGGVSYTDLATSDYFAIGGDSLRYDATPYHRLDMNTNSDGEYGTWYTGQRAVKVAGLWGWHDDYAHAWEDSQDTTENASLAAAGVSVTVNAADGPDLWGATPRFQAGQLIKVGSEQMQITAVGATTLSVIRAMHGTTAAIHAQNTAIYIYRAPDLVRQATITQAARWFKRGMQGYQDASMSPDLGTLRYAQKLDPDIEAMLYDAGLRRVVV